MTIFIITSVIIVLIAYKAIKTKQTRTQELERERIKERLEKEYDVESGRVEGMTGVWIDEDKPTARKICAMGVKSSRWVTMHGIGFNINADLSYFSHIVPCGIQDKAVTSLQQELGRKVDMNEVSEILKTKMSEQFGFEFVTE